MYKRILSLLLVCFMIVLIAPSINALSGPMPLSISGKWYNPQLTGIEKGEEVFTLKTTANGQSVNLNLTFPKEGGIRLYTGEGGVFRPSSVNKIQYTNGANGSIQMKSQDGTTVQYIPGKDHWRLDVFNSSGNMVYRFSKAQIYFGFDKQTLTKVKLTAPVSTGEVIYGTGERYNDVNQMGYRINLWNMDTGYHNSGGNHDDLTWSYKNIPIFHSTRGYTLFFNSTYHGIADIAKSDNKMYSLEFGGPIWDVYIWTNEPLKNLDSYTQLTGRSYLPPKWAFQYWAGQQSGYWKSGQATLDILENVMRGYDELGTPNIAALYGEGAPSGDVRAYTILNRSQTRMLMWFSPRQLYSTIQDWLPGVLDVDLPFPKSLRNNLDVRSDLASIDFSNPNAKAAVSNYFAKYWGYGLRGAMVDFGEYVEQEYKYYNGMSGYEMHNYYPYIYGKTMYDAWTEKLGNDFVLFARAASAGSQRWTANFGGDQASTYAGLKQQVYGGLSLSSSGFSIWGGDIGGHLGTLTPDLYMRWLQFGTFSPLMRAHGISERNPWNFGEEASRTFTMHYWLRENLLDFIYSKAIKSNKTGAPMMQTMALAFPNQKSIAGINDQYIFCDELLVAPVLNSNAYYRTVTIPSGNVWYNLWTGSKQKGGVTIKADAPSDRLPVYVRDGAVIPIKLSETLTLTDSMLDEDGVAALLVTPASKSRTLSYTFEGGIDVSYKNEKLSNGILRITKPDSDSRGAVVLLGSAAAKVLVDGEELERLDVLPNAYDDVGYFVEGHIRTTINLPNDDWKTIEIVPQPDAVNVAKSAVVKDSNGSSQAKAVLNDNPEEFWEASSKGGDWIELDLGSKRNIGSVILKWTRRYASSYAVQVSQDGEDWVDVVTVDESNGGVITHSFDPIEARYVSVLVEENAQREPAALYALEVYSAEKVSLPDDDYYDDEEEFEEEPEEDTDDEDTEPIDDNDDVTDETENKTPVKTKPNNSNSDNGGGMPLALIIGVAAAVVVAAGAAVLGVITVRRRKQAITKNENSPPENEN